MDIICSIIVMAIVVTVALIPSKREEKNNSLTYTQTANEMKKNISKS